MKTSIFSILGALLLIFFTCNNCKQNTSPVAEIIGDSTSFVGDSLLLDGSSSSDAENDSLTFIWAVVSGPVNADEVLHIEGPTSCLFVPGVGGSYTVQLVANDGTNDSDPATMNIEVLDFHGKWVFHSHMPPFPTPIEVLDTMAYNIDGTFEYISYYKYQGTMGFGYKGKGMQETPSGIREWTEYTMPVPPDNVIETFTADHDPYETIKRLNTPIGDFHSEYFLSDHGNTLTIVSDGNNDGDFDDVQDTWSATSDMKSVWIRIE